MEKDYFIRKNVISIHLEVSSQSNSHIFLSLKSGINKHPNQMAPDQDRLEALNWSFELLALENSKLKTDQSYEELKKVLAHYLDRLIIEDFNFLISLLYRIDIPQEKASLALAEKNETTSAGEILAELIIQRQLKKIKTRRAYREGKL
ncbi:MAG: hypothetical protein ACTH6S_02810 [Mesonia sp.]|uniref:hypothetical protein n=2 Tax=Mesonia sp. TaxID=1960830 RepID=UPI003F970390